MSVRNKRLYNDFEKMKTLKLSSPFVDFKASGDPPERYIIILTCKGLAWDKNLEKPSVIEHHELEIYLPQQYPTGKPFVKWLTPIFHPNIMPSDYEKNPGFVCIGSWAPAQSLGDLVVKLAEMIQYKNYEATYDRLNVEAAEWALKNTSLFPVDKRDIIEPEPEIVLDDDSDIVILDD